MHLDPKIALKEENMQEAFNLWAALSTEKEEKLHAKMGELISPSIILNNAKDALDKKDATRLTNILNESNDTYLSNSNMYNRLVDYAINTDKLEYLYAVALAEDNSAPKDNTLDSDMACATLTEVIELSIGERFSEDYAVALNAVTKLNNLSKSSIVKTAFQSVQYSDMSTFNRWMTLQKELLTPEERSKIKLPESTQFVRQLKLQELRENPTLLEFKGVAESIANYAVEYNKLEILELLEDSKVDFNKKNLLNLTFVGPNERKPMMLWMLLNNYPTGYAIVSAIEIKSKKLVNLLLTNGADPNSSPNTLIAAISRKDPELVKQLLNKNADCNVQIPVEEVKHPSNKTALTPLGAAMIFYNTEIFQLIANKAIIDTRPHGFINDQAVPFGPFLQAIANPEILEHFKLRAEKKEVIKAEQSNTQLETTIELG